MTAAEKIMSRDAIAAQLDSIRRQGGKIIFTCGVFDLLHVGHIRFLEYARALGDALVVGVNSDSSVRQLGKGPERPLVAQADRAEVVAGLQSVSYVCVFDELRPDETIRTIRPHVHVKDDAYRRQELPEAAAVRSVGATIVFAPHVHDRSTTALVGRLAKERT